MKIAGDLEPGWLQVVNIFWRTNSFIRTGEALAVISALFGAG